MNESPILCPFCSKQLVAGSGQTHCHHCQKELPANIRQLLHQTPTTTSSSTETTGSGKTVLQSMFESARELTQPPKPGTAAERPAHNPFIQRYIDLYRAARLLIRLGTTIKVIGIVGGILIFLFWLFVGALAFSQSQPNSPFGPSPASQSAAQAVMFFVCVVIGAVLGALVGGLFFLLGVLISAQGQLLLAHADAAVHTSPFLNREEKATAMSERYAPPMATAAAT